MLNSGDVFEVADEKLEFVLDWGLDHECRRSG
jgi:hypothetical protein